MRALVALLLVAVPATAGAQEPYRARIPHRDGSGRATIVDVDPGVPGARDFVRGEERPAPARGELSLPSPTPAASPSPGGEPSRGR